ncbi:MAG: hypothetical protein C5B48_09345 [Candidatus Rokuibacteriota bacterium]|nr:MAG: hypothetical protein C5B48_09345 [Candidatus Rokubacteria bacterium]
MQPACHDVRPGAGRNHLVPIGVAEVKRAGRDVTIIGLAYYVGEALAIADDMAVEGISVEVVGN